MFTFDPFRIAQFCHWVEAPGPSDLLVSSHSSVVEWKRQGLSDLLVSAIQDEPGRSLPLKPITPQGASHAIVVSSIALSVDSKGHLWVLSREASCWEAHKEEINQNAKRGFMNPNFNLVGVSAPTKNCHPPSLRIPPPFSVRNRPHPPTICSSLPPFSPTPNRKIKNIQNVNKVKKWQIWNRDVFGWEAQEQEISTYKASGIALTLRLAMGNSHWVTNYDQERFLFWLLCYYSTDVFLWCISLCPEPQLLCSFEAGV